MFVILVYDVNVKRVAKANKICKKYLNVVQKPVFEGNITSKKKELLQRELKKVLNPEEDTVCIYCLDSLRYAQKIQFGSAQKDQMIISRMKGL